MASSPRTGEVSDGLVLDLEDVDRSEVPRAHEAGELHGIAPVGLTLSPGFFGMSGMCQVAGGLVSNAALPRVRAEWVLGG
jgi:hypothetical protein